MKEDTPHVLDVVSRWRGRHSAVASLARPPASRTRRRRRYKTISDLKMTLQKSRSVVSASWRPGCTSVTDAITVHPRAGGEDAIKVVCHKSRFCGTRGCVALLAHAATVVPSSVRTWCRAYECCHATTLERQFVHVVVTIVLKLIGCAGAMWVHSYRTL
jgi:hypothetical protein